MRYKMSARKCSTWFGFMIAFALGLQGCSSTPAKDTKIAKPKEPVEANSPPQEQEQPYLQPPPMNPY